MKTVINVVLLLLTLAFIFLLYLSIKEPLEFQEARDTRTKSVIDRLRTIRECQEMYRDIYGTYATNFEELATGLKSGRFQNIRVIGDPDDPNFTGEITYDTVFIPAIDSIRSLGFNLDSLSFVPYANGARFDMKTDTIIQGNAIIDVIEVGVQRKAFMGKFADISFKKFDNRYDPESRVKFGDLNSPSLTGNWEGR